MLYFTPDIWIMSLIASKSLMELFHYLGWFGEFLRILTCGSLGWFLADDLLENKKMKTIFIAVLITSTISIAQADERCDTFAELAGTTMELRQAGITLSKVLEIMGDEPVYQAMAIQAYKQPLWRVEENKENAISEYRNEWHLACLDMK